MQRHLIASAALVALLAACQSPQQRALNRASSAAERTLERIPTIGDPGKVAAADFAFARAARDDGNWTAFRAYAAPDAVMDAPGGFAPVTQVLAGLADPPEPYRWAPNTVWSSCDGTLAVSQGRFLRPNGLVGDYITVWELQPDREYRYIYDTGTPDDPQPPPPEPEEIPDGAIVVPGMTSISGFVADCPRAGIPTPPPPQAMSGMGVVGESTNSDDGTLRVTRLLAADGSREVTVEWFRYGNWESATQLATPASPGG